MRGSISEVRSGNSEQGSDLCSCADTCSWQMPAMVPCNSTRKTPAATAASHSALSSPLAAKCAATNDDEHAVCVLMQGPYKVPSPRLAT